MKLFYSLLFSILFASSLFSYTNTCVALDNSYTTYTFQVKQVNAWMQTSSIIEGDVCSQSQNRSNYVINQASATESYVVQFDLLSWYYTVCTLPEVPNSSSTGCELPGSCNDTVPPDFYTYPADAQGVCLPYVSPLTEQFAQGGGLVCDGCFAPYYTPETCIAPKHYNLDLNSSIPSCKIPALLSVVPHDGGIYVYEYEYGYTQFCHNSSGSCNSYTSDGTSTPNLPINDIIFSTIEDLQYSRFLQIGGVTLGVIGGAIAIIGSGGLLTPSVVAASASSAYVGLLGTSAAYFNESVYTLNDSLDNSNSSTSANGITLLINPQDFSTESSSVTNTVDVSGNKVSTINYSDGSQQSVTFTPTDIISETTSIDGTTSTVTMPNSSVNSPISSNDFSATNNIPSTNYSVTTQPPPQIASDGTYTIQPTVTTNYTLDSATNASSTDGTTSSSTTSSGSSIDSSSSSNSSTTSSDGTTSNTTQDFKPITDRLNQMIGQNTLLNNTVSVIKSSLNDSNNKLQELINKATENNNLTSGIKDAVGTSNSKLDELIDKATERNTKLDDIEKAIKDKNTTVKIDLNTTNSLLQDIKSLLQNDSNLTNDINSTGGGQTEDDCGFFHEHFNSVTSTCECDVGWTRNFNNSCLNSDVNSTTNKLLKGIKDAIKDITDSNSTNDTNGTTDSTGDSSLVADIYDSSNQQFSDFYDNMKGQYQTVFTQVDSIKASLDNGFINNLPSGSVTSCPYSKQLDFGFATIPFEVDICNVLSSLYTTFYFLFYVVFFASFFSFIFNLFLNTRM